MGVWEPSCGKKTNKKDSKMCDEYQDCGIRCQWLWKMQKSVRRCKTVLCSTTQLTHSSRLQQLMWDRGPCLSAPDIPQLYWNYKHIKRSELCISFGILTLFTGQQKEHSVTPASAIRIIPTLTSGDFHKLQTITWSISGKVGLGQLNKTQSDCKNRKLFK